MLYKENENYIHTITKIAILSQIEWRGSPIEAK